ncbi:MAG: hypothetical protein KDA76_09650 [Planctomycetaceae bacterium]|nr:hypothetical protein [Planctomycetaceae bacterium]
MNHSGQAQEGGGELPAAGTDETLLAESRRSRVLQGLSLLLLVAAGALSRELWLSGAAYPRIPFLDMFRHVPRSIDHVCLWGTLCGMGLVLWGLLQPGVGRRRSSLAGWGWGVVVAGLVCLMLLNQQRLQVWVWQVVLYGTGFSCLPVAAGLAWARRLTIGIYFYSAISKLDYGFLDTYGQTLLEGLCKSLQWTPVWDPGLAFWIAGLFPMGELLVAVLLLLPGTRYPGWLLSLVMHCCLILTLGPWGLNHHFPVLLWNFFFLAQNTLLFTAVGGATGMVTAGGAQGLEGSKPVAACSAGSLLGRGVLWLALLFPATEWVDVCDIWPGWGLYSARGARARLYLPEGEQHALPPHLRPMLQPAPFGSEWRQLDLHRWSFAALGAPSYPEDRFQLGVIRAVLDQLPPDAEFLIVHQATANRFTGTRRETRLHTREQLEAFSQRYWLNTFARSDGIGRN